MPAPVKPRTALLYLGRAVDTAADQALVARYQFAVLSLWSGMGQTRLQANITGIKARNPNIKLGQYMIMQEMTDVAASNPDYPLWKSVNDNRWWLLNAAGGRTQWTAVYNAYMVNPTAWTTTNSNGQRWPQVKAAWDTSTLLNKMTGIDYVFVDAFGEPVVNADWKRIGTNQPYTDPVVASAFRKGTADYVAALRSLNPALKFIGNSADVSSAEYKGQVEGVGRECLMGKSWSIETYAGWKPMMDSYRAALANTRAPHDVVFGACSPTADPALYRYGIASALLDDGYFAFAQNGYQSLRA